jgi:5-methylcytosine-specific restriction protein A
VGADFPAVGSNFGPPSSGRIPLLLREGMADMRQTGFPAKVKKLIAERASATGDAADAYCEVWEVCHGARSGPAHHRRPRGQGGSRRRDTNLPSNGLSCCPRCHDWIENHRDEAKKHGWLLEQHQSPAEVPVLRRGRLVLLADDGTWTPTEEAA